MLPEDGLVARTEGMKELPPGRDLVPGPRHPTPAAPDAAAALPSVMASPTAVPPWDLSEGDFDPVTKTVIKVFIYADNGFTVYLDEHHSVHCSGSDDARYPERAVEVFNRVSYLETLSIPLQGSDSLLAVRRLLGDAVARMVSDLRTDGAMRMLDTAEAYFHARRAELARMWYLSAAGAVAALLTLLAMGLWLMRPWLIGSLGIGRAAFEVALTTCCGGIGAFMFILRKSEVIRMEVGAGRLIHYFEGEARAVAGMAGGLVVSLALQGDIFSGLSAKLSHPLAFMLVLGLAAGASEKLVPNLVGRVEGSVGMKDMERENGDHARGDVTSPSDGRPRSRKRDMSTPPEARQR
jgi:hypothetical protein